MEKHISVLKDAAINALNIKEDGIYVDMTLGYAGHAKEILKRNKKGFLFAFDKDVNAIEYSKEVLQNIGNNFKIFNSDNTNAKELLEEENIRDVDGILYDLGISSPEIDEKSRGFSYMQDAKLDMRMDINQELSAYEVVNNYKYDDLVRIFRIYGEEKFAGKIAKNIEKMRSIKPIETTFELVDIIDKSIPFKEKRNGHPAKRVFQAIRIEVNNEIEGLKKSLDNAVELLNVDGVLAVITFHSLEDRIVKQKFKSLTEVDKIVKGLPNIDKSLLPDYVLITKKPIIPNSEEIDFNKRSKSAKLRVIKRIK